MNKLIIMATVTALSVVSTAPMAMAGPPTDRELAERRCGNNGGGNDGEFLRRTTDDDGNIVWVCKKNKRDEDHRRDVDPN